MCVVVDRRRCKEKSCVVCSVLVLFALSMNANVAVKKERSLI